MQLACDACVKSQRINWGITQQSAVSTTLNPSNNFTDLDKLNDPEEIFLQRLCLAGNNLFFVQNYKFMLENLNKSKFRKLIKKLRLAAPIYNKCIKWSLNTHVWTQFQSFSISSFSFVRFST